MLGYTWSWLLRYTWLCSLAGVQEALPETRQEQSNSCEEAREGNVNFLLPWFPRFLSLSPSFPFSFPPYLPVSPSPSFDSLPLCFFIPSLSFSPLFSFFSLLTSHNFLRSLPLSSSLLPHSHCNLFTAAQVYPGQASQVKEPRQNGSERSAGTTES